ncbi:MAG: YdeI/OmpD-associated family protein [Chloroflexi bacterium]|nr:YdeI/OmpD-associated family protein [Chloroflexota bacterium]
MTDSESRLSRPIQAMPPEVEQSLHERGLVAAYQARPPYQRNDYLAWIARAKRPETKERRLQQMLSELELGDVYMKMDWRPRRISRDD